MKLVKFGAIWCQPCQQVSKAITSVNFDGVGFVEISIDDNPEYASDMKVRAVPTLILVDSDGNELSRKVGALSAPQIQQWLDSYK